MTTTVKRYFGCKRATAPSPLASYLPIPGAAKLPTSFNLAGKYSLPIFDQGALNTCTMNQLAKLEMYLLAKQGSPTQRIPSRLFGYVNARINDGQVSSALTDVGTTVHGAALALQQLGDTYEDGESAWPYDPAQVNVVPPTACYTKALALTLSKYLAVTQTRLHIKQCLFDGYPIAIGIDVFAGFLSPITSITAKVPMPGKTDIATEGHCLSIWGWDDSDDTFLADNCWGASWGFGGGCKIPQAYLCSTKYAFDAVTPRTVLVA